MEKYVNLYCLDNLNADSKFYRIKAHPCKDGHVVTAPVGSYEPNPYGLFDMLGNVREWARDGWKYSSPQNMPKVDPFWRGGNASHRIARGGGFLSGAEGKFAWRRSHYIPTTASPDLGFRVSLCRTAPPSIDGKEKMVK